ncbi:MAG: cation transporter [Clostridia bacterium]|nr:cation transporter [Clostridia bacterium]
MIDTLRKISDIISGTRTAVLFDEAVTDGMELYDVYSMRGEKTKLIAAGAYAAGDGTYKDALVAAAEELGLVLPEKCDGYYLGSRYDLKVKGVMLPNAVKKVEFSNFDVIFVAYRGKFEGFFLFRRKITEEAKSVVRFFSENRIETMLIGKDKSVSDVGARLSVDKTCTAILKIERKKVLQELGKSDKIIVSESREDVEPCARRVFNEMKKRRFSGLCILSSLAVLMFCILFSAMPLIAFMMAVSTAAYVFYILISLRWKVFSVPQSTGEDKMFGKVNYTMQIGGMSCAHCSAAVKSALEGIRGVSAKVFLEEKVARIKCPASLDVNKLSEAVTEAGFTVVSVEKV